MKITESLKKLDWTDELIIPDISGVAFAAVLKLRGVVGTSPFCF